jgi:hypothetical protein
MAGQKCPVCQVPILPEDQVAFQRGDLIHLRCQHRLVKKAKGAQPEERGAKKRPA